MEATPQEIKNVKVHLRPRRRFKPYTEKRNSIQKPGPFDGRVPIDELKLNKYSRGEQVNLENVKVGFRKKKTIGREKKLEYSKEQAARAEILLTETGGYLEPDEDEVTTQFRQSDIANNVDITSASKRFDLHLTDFGPYRMNYTKNGRFLLLGGKLGHVAAVDWISKKLLCEINVLESTHDVCWLHQETMFAVAQKKWVHIYDSKGVELHCLKKLHGVFKMEFLPYHFLLATVSTNDIISWLDVSIGKLVTQFRIHGHSTAPAVAQHPANALICVGQTSGIITLWSPNSKRPAVTKWCHKQPIAAVAFDPYGIHLATASVDKSVKIWDARNLTGPTQEYKLFSTPHCMTYSHKSTLALGLGNIVEVYNDRNVDGVSQKKIYLRHKIERTISNMQFCPFEDVLGVAHGGGFTSMLVPGSGEANFDALEVNPYQTKSQRREAEVQALLGKIPSELITWDPKILQKLHTPSLLEIIEQKKKLLHVKPPEIEVNVKKKKKASKTEKTKSKLKLDLKRKYKAEIKDSIEQEFEQTNASKVNEPHSVLDRFKPKPRNKKK